MARFEKSLRDWLAAEIEEVGGRVVPNREPAGIAVPYIRYVRVTTDREYAHDGYTGLASVLMQLSIFADNKDKTKAIARKIQERLQDYRGVMGDTYIHGAFLDDEESDYDDDTTYYSADCDYLIQYYE